MAKSDLTTPEYVALRKCYEQVIGVVSSDPGSLCDALFSKGCITKHVKNYTRNDSVLAEDKARKLIDSVMDRIELEPNVFIEFIEALKSPHHTKLKEKLNECYQIEKNCPTVKPPPSICDQELKPSLKEISDEDSNLSTNAESFQTSSSQADSDSTSFVCPYCKHCSLEKYLSDEGCPQAAGRTLFPYLNTQELSEEDRVVLEDSLVCAAKDLRALFADTDTYIAQNLHADVTIVKNFVLDLVRDLEQEENVASINRATSIPEIILALQPYKSFLNYEIIERIANKFGSTEICAEMRKYVTAFTSFCKRSAFELPNNVLPNKVKSGNEKIFSVKLTKKGLSSLDDVVSARRKMANILGVNKWTLKICSIEDGCLCVRFLVPAAVMSKILPLSPDRKNALRDAGISIGEEKIFQSEVSNR